MNSFCFLNHHCSGELRNSATEFDDSSSSSSKELRCRTTATPVPFIKLGICIGLFAKEFNKLTGFGLICAVVVVLKGVLIVLCNWGTGLFILVLFVLTPDFGGVCWFPPLSFAFASSPSLFPLPLLPLPFPLLPLLLRCCFLNFALRFLNQTCTLASGKLVIRASLSRVTTSGYWVSLKVFSRASIWPGMKNRSKKFRI